MVKTKKRRVVIKKFEDLIYKENEPYSSILKILFFAPQVDEIFKEMETKELCELIVKRYEMSPKYRKPVRYQKFLLLKKKLGKYPDIHLDQNIEPDSPNSHNKSTDHHRFQSYLQILKTKGYIDNPNKGYWRVSLEFIANPFNNWVKRFISECPIKHSAAWRNSYLYMPHIPINKLNYEEIFELKCLLFKATLCFSEIEKFLSKVGYRKANVIWKSFIYRIDCSGETKFYFWLYLLSEIIVSSEKPFYFIDQKKNQDPIITALNLDDQLRYKSWFDEYEKNEEVKNWGNDFRDIIYKAFVKYIKKIKQKEKIHYIKKRFEKEYRDYIDKLHNIMGKMSQEYYLNYISILLLYPDYLTHQHFESYGMPKIQSVELDDAIRYMNKGHPFVNKFIHDNIKLTKKWRLEENNKINKNYDQSNKNSEVLDILNDKIADIIQNTQKSDFGINDQIQGKTNYLKDIDFFNGFEKELIELGFQNLDEVYSMFNPLVQMFTMPE